MRKLIVSMNVTLDGFMSGPHCELDWHFRRWNREMGSLMTEQLSEADTILLGRTTYMAMAKHWPSITMDASYPVENILFAHMMNTHYKIVFSQTLTKPEWKNSVVVNGDVEREVIQLKEEKGKNIIVYGSGKLVPTLMQLDLIDEYYIWIHPVVLGKGRLLFKNEEKMKLYLTNTQTFSSGVVLCSYKTKPLAIIRSL